MMQNVEIIIVALIVLGALVYLFRTFKPNSKKKGSCGCGTVDCKVPKREIKKPAENSSEC